MAQNITGIVIDNNHKPVEFATIVLLNQQDSTYSQKEMVCELDKRNLRVRSDSNSSL